MDLFDDDDVDLDAMLGVEPDEPEPEPPPGVRLDPRRRKVVCKHWLRGLCKKGDDCDFLHQLDRDRMPECWFFSNFGECSNKDCIFLHLRPEDKVHECPWFARGFCKHGPRCRNRHTRKKPCPKYLAGFCPDGPNCQFGHAKYELPVLMGLGPMQMLTVTRLCTSARTSRSRRIASSTCCCAASPLSSSST